ncbi:MAG: hydrolase TatD [Candidatus Buchananbacteria bacterium]|nr:hydrolase TatD [Candidatus Buchananbacteria bacterium]
MLIDSHAHINFHEYAAELNDVVQRSFDNKTWIINVGSNYETSQKTIDIAKKFGKGIWAVIGCHPIHLVKDVTEKASFGGEEHSFFTPKEKFSARGGSALGGDYDKYLNLAQSSDTVVGIGETGLDFFRMADEEYTMDKIKEIQINVFKQFIQLAKRLDLPLVLHCRGEESDPYGAYDLILDILEKEDYHKGVIHCYGGNKTQARKFLNLGFYVGFTGIVTFKNAQELQEIAKETPLDKILIETDAPFLAPEPYRGQKNEPYFVRYIAQKIADLKELTFTEIEKQTFNNAVKLFNLQ